MDQQQALQYARGMMDNGMSAADANVALVRMIGVRQVIGWNLWPERLNPEAFRDALGRMAKAWGM